MPLTLDYGPHLSCLEVSSRLNLGVSACYAKPMRRSSNILRILRRRRAGLGRFVVGLFAFASVSLQAAPCFAMATSAAPPPWTTYNFFSLGITASQLIYDFGQTDGRMRVARSNARAFEWSARSALLPFLPAAVAAAVCTNVPGDPLSRLLIGLGVGLACLAWIAASGIGRDYIGAVRAT